MEKTRLDRAMELVFILFCLAVLGWMLLLVLGAGWL